MKMSWKTINEVAKSIKLSALRLKENRAVLQLHVIWSRNTYTILDKDRQRNKKHPYLPAPPH